MPDKVPAPALGASIRADFDGMVANIVTAKVLLRNGDPHVYIDGELFKAESTAHELLYQVDLLLAQLTAAQTRAEQAEAQLGVAVGVLNTPEVEDFDKAIPLEAAHQVQRWGTKHDGGKGPQDWFWLIGYLAGKCLRSHIEGNAEKAKHHAITVAAACRNWHAAIRSGDSLMRPGIEPPAAAALAALPAASAEVEKDRERLAYLRDNSDVYLRSTADGVYRAYTTDHDEMFDPCFAKGNSFEECLDAAIELNKEPAIDAARAELEKAKRDDITNGTV